VRTEADLEGAPAPADFAAAVQRAQSLAKLYGDRAIVRTGADASESAARELLEQSDVLDIAAPLEIDKAAPLLSSVLLAGSGDRTNDGRWEAREWFGETAAARVLVLADGAALDRPDAGMVMDALAWSAAAAGVPTIIAARAASSGFSPEALERALHEHLAHGEPPADAWSAAVAAMRVDRSTPPSAWASLRLLGAAR
ncbi:MAG: CHAT domain-containing protein, partial [Vicinamibacterales bacterium]